MKAKIALFALALVVSAPAFAQAPPPTTARASAPMDLVGQWVSIVSEDWRWRMVTPPKGDYASLPLSPAGRAAADAWNLDADNAAGPAGQCKVFGVGGIVRIPGRMRIAWTDDATLKVDYDAGQQTRLFKFINQRPGPLLPALSARTPSQAAPSLQGETRAQWFRQAQVRGLGRPPPPGPGGSLRLFTVNHTNGYLRKNGVPYSADALISEHWNLFKGPDNGDWLVITTIIEDPLNLNQPFYTSTNFKREADPSKWNPQPCRTPASLEAPIPPPPPRATVPVTPVAAPAR